MKFLQNKYTNLYYDIIENRKATPLLDSYTENHHILPDSMGGSDDDYNMVRLSAREHFLCHYLLTKMLLPYSTNWYKMIKAFMMMKSSSDKQDRYFNSRLYESKRVEFSKAQSECQKGEKNSQHNTTWVYSEKEDIRKKIKKDDLQQWLDIGWINRKCSEWFEMKCDWCKANYKSKEYIRPSRIKFCSDECDYNYKTVNHQQKASDYYYMFKHGDYSSVRDFCRKESNVSHVTVMKMWKLYISGFESEQGKSLISE